MSDRIRLLMVAKDIEASTRQAWFAHGIVLSGPVMPGQLPQAMANGRYYGALVDVAFDADTLDEVSGMMESKQIPCVFVTTPPARNGAYILDHDEENIAAILRGLVAFSRPPSFH